MTAAKPAGKAYIDTTILTDALIKSGAQRDQALNAISRYAVSELPQYAIKEFKDGPLSYYVWMHNKLETTGSFTAALGSLQKMSMSPRKHLPATAIQALQTAADSLSRYTSQQMVDKYGPTASPDQVQCDEYRLAIKTAIFLGWQQRHSVTTNVVCPLSCYNETDPYEKRGMIMLENRKCKVDRECCLAPDLKAAPDDLMKLHKATLSQPSREELRRRAKALRQLFRKPKDPLDEKSCRALGDAIFAFFAPDDAVIVTTNDRDHAPLAAALGKRVDKP